MAKPQNPVAKLYETVIEDVINNVRESFLDDGVDDQVLQELKQIWEAKLAQTKAVDSPILGDRPTRPPMYTYLAQTSGQQRAGQPVVYQTIPAQTIQLSGASQQARRAASDVVYQQQGGSLVLPAQNQLYTPYHSVTVLGQPGVQIQQTRATVGSAQPIVLTSVPQAGGSQQQQVGGKQQPSAIIQLDGTNEDELSQNQPSTSKAPSPCAAKIHPAGCRRKTYPKKKKSIVVQLDGGNDSSSSEDVDDDDNDDDDDDEDDDEDEEAKEEEKPDEEPLCSADDDSDQDANELFDTDNVVVCQYDKIHRAKAKWKFTLKVGIMNLKGKDQVFQKAVGEADW